MTRPAVVVLGLRADFYGHCAQIPELVPYLQDNQILVTAMTAAERREAITGPARTAELTIEPGLVDLLLAESTGQSLPQLAHVLRRVFAHRRDRTLTVAGYRATGGIAQAVAATAETIHHALDVPDQQLLRRLLVSMVAIVDGAEDTRRRVHREHLLDAGTDLQQVDRILSQLIDERLVTAEDDSYMLSHEALIRSWPRLQVWLSEDRDGLRLHRELAHRARAWDHHDRDPGSLYAGAELELTRRWAEQHPDHLNHLERDFYHASLAAEHARHTATRTRQRNRRRQLHAVSGLLVLALTAALLAWQQRDDALHQQRAADQQRHVADTAARTALARQLAAQTEAIIDTNPDLAALLAVESYRIEPTREGRSALATAARLPLKRLLSGHTRAVRAVAFSPDGAILATASDDSTVRLWNAHTGHLIAPLGGHTRAVRTVAFSPDSAILATGSDDSTARLLNAHTGRLIATLTGHSAPVAAVTFSPDGTILATASGDSTARLWNVHTGHVITTLRGHTDAVRAVAFSPDGTTLATISPDRTTRLWNAHTGRRTAMLASHRGGGGNGEAVAFSPDGTILASTDDWDGSTRLWNTHTGRPIATLTAAIHPVAFSPDGTILATASPDSATRLWNAHTGHLIMAVPSGGARVWTVAFSPDSATLATGYGDGTTRLWNTHTHQLTATLTGHTRVINAVAFSPDGDTLATASDDHTTRLWTVHTGRPTATLPSYIGRPSAVAFSPDGTNLATASRDGATRLWTAQTGYLTATLSDHTGRPSAVAFSPSGNVLAVVSHVDNNQVVRLFDTHSRRLIVSLAIDYPVYAYTVALSRDGGALATMGYDDTVRLFDTHNHRLIFSVTDKRGGSLNAVALSPHSDILAVTTEDGAVRLFDTHTRQLIATTRGRTGHVRDMTFSPDGRSLATVADDNTVRLFDTNTHLLMATVPATIPGYTGRFLAVAFSPDSRTLATAGEDNIPRVWDARTGQPITHLPAYTGRVRAVAFSRNGDTLTVASNDKTVQLWTTTLAPSAQIRMLCETVARDLTTQEWSQFLPGQPYERTCQTN